MRSGYITVAPTPKFTIFSNSTALTRMVDPPCMLVRMTAQDFIQRALWRQPGPKIRWDPEYYYFQSAEPPQQLERIILDSQISAVQPQNLILRVTAEESVHGLHHDKLATGLVQLSGHKQIKLISRTKYDLVQYVPHGVFARRSSLDLQDEKTALALDAVTIDMKAGDVLLFPPQVGHESKAITDSTTVSFWYT